MMAIVKMDEKGRIQVPSGLRAELKLKVRQPLLVTRQGEGIVVKKVSRVEPMQDPLLRDFILRPLKSKVKVTKKLLDQMEEEQWSG
ncbi:MAG: AbrB/MazE/SpoVT family DNA-binding domain-containing protein [Candidatus Aenigmarchaeota archaeon]|nr:AbrB/MazE/SpoVT family DNA-binding domain-containing protein [Candidatus Aenigmarchaeota archaeon]